MASSALAAERHTILLRSKGSGFVGQGQGEQVALELDFPEEVLAADKSRWRLETLSQRPDFQLLGASLRWTVRDLRGRKLEYTLLCGEEGTTPQRVLEGTNIWEVTKPISAWLAAPEMGLRIAPAHRKNQRGFQVEEGSISLQITFSTTANLPLFPLDRVWDDPIYDASLSLLEADSPFLARYDETADSLLSAELPLGVPYYYAGRNPEKFLHRYFPRSTTNYYRADRMYFCGLDCVGMTYLVYRGRGLEEHPSIPEILQRGIGSGFLQGEAPEKWSAILLPGDLIALHHGSLHILMYVGTLRHFGWTEEEAGEAGEILDLPLVIHCGGNPFYYDRYLAYIQEKGYQNTFPPDGGVTVSVVQKTLDEAPHTRESSWGKTYGWYQLEGSPLTVFPLSDCTQLAWHGEAW